MEHAEMLHDAVLAVNDAVLPRDVDGNDDVEDVPYTDLGPKTRTRYEMLIEILVHRGVWNLQ